MVKFSAYVATSLDGFIARPNGDIDWLMNADLDTFEDYGYAHFMSTVDCLVLGRKTFEKLLSFPEWPHDNKRVIVISRTLHRMPPASERKTELYSGTIGDLAVQLESEGIRRVYVDGGETIQSFMKAGLLTDMTVTVIPTLIGSGLPLFGEFTGDLQLEHKETRCYKSGFVQSVYHLLDGKSLRKPFRYIREA